MTTQTSRSFPGAPNLPSTLSVLLSALACATCPVCLGGLAGALSLLGVGFSWLEPWHRPLTLFSVGIAWLSLAHAARSTRRPGILAFASIGAFAVVLGEFGDEERHWLTYGGYGLLALTSLRSWRRPQAGHDHCCGHSAASHPHYTTKGNSDSPGRQQRIAFLTSFVGAGPRLTKDDRIAADALRARGFQVVPVAWDDPFPVDLVPYSAAVIRSTWGYQHDPQRFRDWIASLRAAGLRLLNPAELVLWNMDKATYLSELSARGIVTPPTLFLQRGSGASLEFLLRNSAWTGGAVFKPSISASAFGTELVTSTPTLEQEIRFASMLEERDLLLQQYLPEIRQGEWSLVFFNDGSGAQFSHAALKKPTANEFRVQPSLGGRVERANPSKTLLETAEAVLRHLKEPWLYARVDLVVRRPQSAPTAAVLMELELIEPALFFSLDPAAPQKLADALVQQLSHNKHGEAQ